MWYRRQFVSNELTSLRKTNKLPFSKRVPVSRVRLYVSDKRDETPSDLRWLCVCFQKSIPQLLPEAGDPLRETLQEDLENGNVQHFLKPQDSTIAKIGQYLPIRVDTVLHNPILVAAESQRNYKILKYKNGAGEPTKLIAKFISRPDTRHLPFVHCVNKSKPILLW